MTRRHTYEDEDDTLLMALQNTEPCGNCGENGASVPCMSGCGEVFYCSRECMMHHASAHRLRCRNLRCSKFNDSDSESDSSDYEEFTDDSDEYESGSEEEEEEEERKRKSPAKKKPGKRSKSRSGRSVGSDRRGSGGGGRTDSDRSASMRKISVDSEAERRIEEKILRRLKKQEESRIAMAIEQRMREEKATWRDEEMNRIIMEMRTRFQSEMANPAFLGTLSKRHGTGSETASPMLTGASSAPARPSANESPDLAPLSEEKMAASAAPTAAENQPLSPTTLERGPVWNNHCSAFAALRVVVWKHHFLPRMTFNRDPMSGLWNAIAELDADESFSHISIGDTLAYVNGRPVDSSVQSQEDLDDIFAACPSPLIMKFVAKEPDNGKVHEYTVTWSNGPLGVTLKDDCSSEKVPIVNRLTKKAGSVAVKQNIAIGDILVAINNIDTIQLGCSLSMSILKKVQLPAKLRFRGVGGPLKGTSSRKQSVLSSVDGDMTRPSSPRNEKEERFVENDDSSSDHLSMSRPSTYVIQWGEGPLGLTIIPGFEDNDLPVIKKVTGSGNSNGIEKAQVGDYLVSMNDVQTANKPFEEVVAYLKHAPKPVVLTFRAGLMDEPCETAVAMPKLDAPSVSTNATKTDRGSSYMGSQSSDFSDGRDEKLSSSLKSMELSGQNSRSSSGRGSNGAATYESSREDTYYITWGNGPLGLTIDAAPNTPGVFIKRIAPQGAASSLSMDCIGDDLTHINDKDVTRLMFADIVDLLKAVPRPVSLAFRRNRASSNTNNPAFSNAKERGRLTDTPVRGARAISGSNEVQYYNVVWQEGTSLGLSLRGADGSNEYPFITRVTGSGSAAHLPDSVVGDLLVSVDGRSVHCADRNFDEVMAMLKTMPKPITLKFQASINTIPRGMSSGNVPVPPPPPAMGTGRPKAPYQSPTVPAKSRGSAGSVYPPPAAPTGPHSGLSRSMNSGSQHIQQDHPYNQPSQQHYQGHPHQQSHSYQQTPSHPYQQNQQNQSYQQASTPQYVPSQSYSNYNQNQRMMPSAAGSVGASSSSGSRNASGSSQSSFNRSVSSERALDVSVGDEEKFSSIQAPFLAPNKLSAGRRQKMLKGLKK